MASSLPYRAWTEIMLCLSTDGIIRNRLVCKNWSENCNYNDFWLLLAKRDCGECYEIDSENQTQQQLEEKATNVLLDMEESGSDSDYDDSSFSSSSSSSSVGHKKKKNLLKSPFFCEGRACYAFATMATISPFFLRLLAKRSKHWKKYDTKNLTAQDFSFLKSCVVSASATKYHGSWSDSSSSSSSGGGGGGGSAKKGMSYDIRPLLEIFAIFGLSENLVADNNTSNNNNNSLSDDDGDNDNKKKQTTNSFPRTTDKISEKLRKEAEAKNQHTSSKTKNKNKSNKHNTQSNNNNNSNSNITQNILPKHIHPFITLRDLNSITKYIGNINIPEERQLHESQEEVKSILKSHSYQRFRNALIPSSKTTRKKKETSTTTTTTTTTATTTDDDASSMDDVDVDENDDNNLLLQPICTDISSVVDSTQLYDMLYITVRSMWNPFCHTLRTRMIASSLFGHILVSATSENSDYQGNNGNSNSNSAKKQRQEQTKQLLYDTDFNNRSIFKLFKLMAHYQIISLLWFSVMFSTLPMFAFITLPIFEILFPTVFVVLASICYYVASILPGIISRYTIEWLPWATRWFSGARKFPGYFVSTTSSSSKETEISSSTSFFSSLFSFLGNERISFQNLDQFYVVVVVILVVVALERIISKFKFKYDQEEIISQSKNPILRSKIIFPLRSSTILLFRLPSMLTSFVIYSHFVSWFGFSCGSPMSYASNLLALGKDNNAALDSDNTPPTTQILMNFSSWFYEVPSSFSSDSSIFTNEQQEFLEANRFTTSKISFFSAPIISFLFDDPTSISKLVLVLFLSYAILDVLKVVKTFLNARKALSDNVVCPTGVNHVSDFCEYCFASRVIDLYQFLSFAKEDKKKFGFKWEKWNHDGSSHAKRKQRSTSNNNSSTILETALDAGSYNNGMFGVTLPPVMTKNISEETNNKNNNNKDLENNKSISPWRFEAETFSCEICNKIGKLKIFQLFLLLWIITELLVRGASIDELMLFLVITETCCFAVGGGKFFVK